MNSTIFVTIFYNIKGFNFASIAEKIMHQTEPPPPLITKNTSTEKLSFLLCKERCSKICGVRFRIYLQPPPSVRKICFRDIPCMGAADVRKCSCRHLNGGNSQISLRFQKMENWKNENSST